MSSPTDTESGDHLRSLNAYIRNERDDWRLVDDPKEKKRRQNRVAQRLYRQRQKEHIQEMKMRLRQTQTAHEQSSASPEDLRLSSWQEMAVTHEKRLGQATMGSSRDHINLDPMVVMSRPAGRPSSEHPQDQQD